VFVKSFVGGAVVGFGGSLAYLIVSRSSELGASILSLLSMPKWSPFRKISEEEVKERQSRY